MPELSEESVADSKNLTGVRVMARVAWKPFNPGITTSIRMRSGISDFARSMAISPLSAVSTS